MNNLPLTKKNIIFCGYYGSGKTEVSINYALKLSKEMCKTTLIDLDIINPYYRSRDESEFLYEKGIITASSSIQSMGTDLPALSPKILGLLQQKDTKTVIDLGGDDLGAKILRRFKQNISSYDLVIVVNVFRPFTKDEFGILEMIESIQDISGMNITGLVNNSNLGKNTRLEHLIKGNDIISSVKSKTEIPIVFHSIKKELYTAATNYNFNEPILPLDFFMVPTWEKPNWSDGNE